jgi:hypothetical protein
MVLVWEIYMRTATLRQLASRSFLTLLVIALTVEVSPRVLAQISTSNQPDVQAIIMRGANGTDMVNITYPKIIPASQAARDVAALAQDANLGAVNVDVTNAAEKLDKIKATPMTSATFAAHGIMPDENRETAFRLEPWVVALKNYHAMTITYVMDRDFGFNGLRQFRNNNVEIALEREGNAYTYRVLVVDPRFDRLNLPFLQADANHIVVAQAPAKRPWYIAAILGISAIAAGFGYAVWAFLTKMV